MHFYCKTGDKERDNFDSIGRAFLAQLLKANKDNLLQYYYDAFSNSSEAVLNDLIVIDNLLSVAMKNCENVYVVLDGIDECSRNERKKISDWFRGLVLNLPTSKPDRIRCLFVSQDDGFARKDFAGLTMLKIQKENVKADIDEYSSVWAEKIQSKFEISDDVRLGIITKISTAADGKEPSPEMGLCDGKNTDFWANRNVLTRQANCHQLIPSDIS